MSKERKLKVAVRKTLCGVGRVCSPELKASVFKLSTEISSNFSLSYDGFGRKSLSTLVGQAFKEKTLEASLLLAELKYSDISPKKPLLFNLDSWHGENAESLVSSLSEELLKASIFLDLDIKKYLAGEKLGLTKSSVDRMSEDLELIRYVILALVDETNPNKTRFCQYCFRKIYGWKSCTQHVASESYPDLGLTGNKGRTGPRS